MVRVIALTQFVFLALGTMALVILMKTHPEDIGTVHDWREFLTRHGYWTPLIPILWVVIVAGILRMFPGERTLKGVQASGFVVAAAIVLVYGWLIMSF